jgi:hypothetical protein
LKNPRPSGFSKPFWHFKTHSFYETRPERRIKIVEEKMSELKPPQFYRQRFLLALLYFFDKKLTKTDFQKYLFLYQQEYAQGNETYYFLPYNTVLFPFSLMPT